MENMLPETFAKQLRKHWETSPDIFQLNERALVKKMYQSGCPPTAAEKELRYKFWSEFNRVMDEPRSTPMQFAFVIGRSISKEQFYRAIVNPHFMAYIILPPESYQMKVELALDISMNRVLEYLETVEVNQETIDKVFKIQQSLLGKVKGFASLAAGRKEVVEKEAVVKEPEETPEQKLTRLRAEVERRRAEKAALEAKNDTPPDLDAV